MPELKHYVEFYNCDKLAWGAGPWITEPWCGIRWNGNN